METEFLMQNMQGYVNRALEAVGSGVGKAVTYVWRHPENAGWAGAALATAGAAAEYASTGSFEPSLGVAPVMSVMTGNSLKAVRKAHDHNSFRPTLGPVAKFAAMIPAGVVASHAALALANPNTAPYLLADVPKFLGSYKEFLGAAAALYGVGAAVDNRSDAHYRKQGEKRRRIDRILQEGSRTRVDFNGAVADAARRQLRSMGKGRFSPASLSHEIAAVKKRVGDDKLFYSGLAEELYDVFSRTLPRMFSAGNAAAGRRPLQTMDTEFRRYADRAQELLWEQQLELNDFPDEAGQALRAFYRSARKKAHSPAEKQRARDMAIDIGYHYTGRSPFS